jgi:predicted permease
MTDFTKTKMHFALALLGTLFALHPLLDPIKELGFRYLDYDLKILYVYALISGLLAFTAYCYAMALLSERPASRVERLGNYTYAVAIGILPLYGGLYLSSLLADLVGESHLAWAAPMVALGLGVLWLAAGWFMAWRVRRRLGERDRTAKIEQLVGHELEALNRAQELFGLEHYDLAVIEAWKAIEARLRRVLLLRGISRRADTPQAMIAAATRAGILRAANLELLQELRKQWNVAISTEPLTKQAADAALSAARHILATIPIDDPRRPASHNV